MFHPVAIRAAVVAMLMLGVTSPIPAAPRPNIIYIMCDDLGYGDLGCYGQKVIRTPHIDKLAAEGLRFTDHYSGHTVCRPSRLVLWTGYHTGHTAINSNAGYTFKPDDVLVSEFMQKAGYITGGVGKWAMGKPDTQGVPHLNGFDFWFGYLDQSEAHNFYPTHLWRCRGERMAGGPRHEKVPLRGNVLMGDSGREARVARPDGRVTYSHDVMTDEAIGFVRKHARGDRPFFLHVHWTIPHTNNEGGAVTGDGQEVPDYGIYNDKDWPNPEKGFAAMVTRMDGDVGRLIALLRELKIEKDTLVVFTSDNGPHQEGGHKMEFFDSNGPLRGYKRSLHDGGIRVPMIAWWPGTVEAGAETDHPSAFWDWLPTACELAGAQPPRGIDGISYAPTLLGKPGEQTKHEYLYWRQGGVEAVRAGKWKAVRPGKGKPVQLYDLSTDIGEANDLAAGHSDIAARMAEFMEDATRRPR